MLTFDIHKYRFIFVAKKVPFENYLYLFMSIYIYQTYLLQLLVQTAILW